MSFWQPKIYIPVVHFIDILRAAFAPIFFSQKLQRQTLIRENLRTVLLYEKGAHKMLMKLTPGFDLRCQFHPRFSRAFFVRTSFFLIMFWLWRQNFVRKTRA